MTDFLKRIDRWLTDKPHRADASAILVLLVLWAFYFWRVLTPNAADRVSLPEGDYSGQFLSFGAYQARRLLSGEIPLWNPYNYGGLPFIADTQAAVFYPPRLITIFASAWFFEGWNYSALQAETLAHYLLASLFMYLFIRTITQSRIAGLISGLTFAYGGFLTGYPPLQLAVLEAAVWLPLALLGVYKASETEGGWSLRWLALTPLALGIGLLAGHPQTSLFTSYVLIAYIIHRAVKQHIGWKLTTVVLGIVLVVGFGLAAVQVLPGLEYTRLTIRAAYGFQELANGFPYSDLLTVIYPNSLTVWSPLYSGIVALVLAAIAVWMNAPQARFWLVVGLVELGLSFGGATILYHLAYLAVPGFALFRGQERAAYVIAACVAILAGIGFDRLRQGNKPVRLSLVLGYTAIIGWILALEIFIGSLFFREVVLFNVIKAAFSFALLASLAWAFFGREVLNVQLPSFGPIAIALVVFDLFSATIGTNFEPVPALQRDFIGPLVDTVQQDELLYRVDGRYGLGENYGTLLNIQDIRGTSPLRLGSLEQYVSRLPQSKLYQMLAVKYVFTDAQQLEQPSSIIDENDSVQPPQLLHEIDEPMPRAWMAYNVFVAPSDAQALGFISDPAFDLRTNVTLPAQPKGMTSPATPPTDWQITIVDYQPESIRLEVETPEDGVLVLSEFDYPGWQAKVDSEPAEIWRANAGLRGIPLTAGSYDVVFEYRPLSVRIGAVVSVVSVLVIVGAMVTNARTSIR